MIRTLCAILLCLGLVACGGGGGSNNTVVNPPPAPPPPPTPTVNPPATTPPSPPAAVAAGSTGVNIVVPGASTNPVLNSVVLGGTGGGGRSAFSTGDFISRQTATATVLLFGQGLSATNTVRISGSGDVAVVPGSVQSIQSTGTPPTPGIRFQVSVTPNAVLGARTVFITSGNDMTTFTGGLEVVQ